MAKAAKALTLVVIGALILGCEGPKIKQALDELTPKVTELENMLTNTEATIGKATEIARRIEGNSKITKAQIDTVTAELDQIKTKLTVLLAVQDAAKDVQDSLAVLDKRAKDDNKKATTALTERVNGIFVSIGKIKGCVCMVDQLKLKLDEMKKATDKKGKKAKK